MQVFGLPGHVTRVSGLASRVCAAERSEAAQTRAEILDRWRRARANGLTAAEAADAVGVSRATLYRWQRRLEPASRRPRRVRRPGWSPAVAAAVERYRAEYPMWGKAKITVLLRREGQSVSESTVGRILRRLMARGRIAKVSHLRRKGPRAKRRERPYAKRLAKGHKPTTPGELLQLDTLSISLGNARPPIKHFTAYDPISKWTCAKAHRAATAGNAKRFLDKILAEFPFPIRAIQVDGGSEFKAEFESACQLRRIPLWELPPKSPQLNGHVERNNGSWRYEFYATWNLPDDNLDKINYWIDAFAYEFNTFRPHQALAGKTPLEYLTEQAANETPASHMD